MADDPKMPEKTSPIEWHRNGPEEKQAVELTLLDLEEWFRSRWPGSPETLSARMLDVLDGEGAGTGIGVDGWIMKPPRGWPKLGGKTPEDGRVAEEAARDLLEWLRERWPGVPVAARAEVLEPDPCAEIQFGVHVEGWIPKPSDGWPQMGETEDPADG